MARSKDVQPSKRNSESPCWHADAGDFPWQARQGYGIVAAGSLEKGI
jgi:hypothetical protein